ncbi:MAG: LPXTG cell wall anchor domain-containing protein, partial [Thermoplasmata archaeon]|nr:LPXTG cell wall anchor domain-containing protein [Thermoplasmata archaeon]
DSLGSLENDETQPFVKPVSGFTKFENCIIRKGVIDNEVRAEIEAINLTIHSLRLYDQSISRIYRSRIHNEVVLGAIGLFYQDVGEKSKASLILKDSIVGTIMEASGSIFATGKSNSIMKNCTIKNCLIQEDGTVEFIESKIEQLIDVKHNGTLNLRNTSVPKIFLNEDSKLKIYSSPDIAPVERLTTQYNCRSEIDLNNVDIEILEIWPGDNIPPPYGSDYIPNKNVSKIDITMFQSTLGEVFSMDDVELYFTLLESSINKFKFTKFKDEPAKVSILDLGGEFKIPDKWPEADLTISIYYEINFITFVNNKRAIGHILVTNNKGQKVLATPMNEKGEAEIELLFEQYTNTTPTPAGEYTINVSHQGFYEIIKTLAKMNDEHIVEWEDHTPPVIEDVTIHDEFLRTERNIRVKAMISDADVKVIANATIYFQYYIEDRGWSKWYSTEMFEVENNTFENDLEIEDLGDLEQLPQGAKIRYYIIANDVCGNRVVSGKYTHDIPKTDERNIIITSILAIVIILLIIIYLFRRRRKVKKYINRPIISEARVDELLNRK